MNARVPPAKMEAHAQTMLTPTPAPVSLALLASTVKPTSLIALKGEGLIYCDISLYFYFIIYHIVIEYVNTPLI